PPAAPLALALQNFELRPAVPAPRRLVVALHCGVALPEAQGVHARRGDADGRQVLLDRGRAPLAEREVVLFAAALVAVSLDHDRAPLRVAVDLGGVAAQCALLVLAPVRGGVGGG